MMSRQVVEAGSVLALSAPPGQTGSALFQLIPFALVLGILPSLPGFLVQVKLLQPANVAPFLVSLYNYAWFIGLGAAFVAYLAGKKVSSRFYGAETPKLSAQASRSRYE